MYLSESALIKTQKNIEIQESFLDAYRRQLKEQYKANEFKRKAVLYTYKNGKLFFFFNKEALGPINAFTTWFNKIRLKVLMALVGAKFDEKDKKELEKVQIKKGADVHDIASLVEYYEAIKHLDAIRYNKLCNTWDYFVMPLIEGKKYEDYYRKLINELNGVAMPERVLEDPNIYENIFECSKDKKKKANKK